MVLVRKSLIPSFTGDQKRVECIIENILLLDGG